MEDKQDGKSPLETLQKKAIERGTPLHFLLFLKAPCWGPVYDICDLTVLSTYIVLISGLLLSFYLDNYYGTPKPPAEPTPLLLNVTDQILPGATPSSEGKRKRNKSVSNMEKTGIEPPEEEEEERPVVNGNGMAITPGQWIHPHFNNPSEVLFFKFSKYFTWFYITLEEDLRLFHLIYFECKKKLALNNFLYSQKNFFL